MDGEAQRKLERQLSFLELEEKVKRKEREIGRKLKGIQIHRFRLEN